MPTAVGATSSRRSRAAVVGAERAPDVHRRGLELAGRAGRSSLTSTPSMFLAFSRAMTSSLPGALVVEHEVVAGESVEAAVLQPLGQSFLEGIRPEGEPVTPKTANFFDLAAGERRGSSRSIRPSSGASRRARSITQGQRGTGHALRSSPAGHRAGKRSLRVPASVSGLRPRWTRGLARRPSSIRRQRPPLHPSLGGVAEGKELLHQPAGDEEQRRTIGIGDPMSRRSGGCGRSRRRRRARGPGPSAARRSASWKTTSGGLREPGSSSGARSAPVAGSTSSTASGQRRSSLARSRAASSTRWSRRGTGFRSSRRSQREGISGGA